MLYFYSAAFISSKYKNMTFFGESLFSVLVPVTIVAIS